MRDYIIYTDSGCDIRPEVLKEWGVPYSSLTFKFDGEEQEYSNSDMAVKDFYDKMRAGGVARTSAVNVGTFLEGFETLLKEGKDILYIGFSTGLSTTANSAQMAAEQLREQYPDRKIIALDTLSASAGQGLLVWMAVEQRKNGASIEEAAAYVQARMNRVIHWVTVDDLVYLKRGGRISPTVAFVGNALGLKPLIYVDKNGKLESVGKVRGRKKAIATLAEKYVQDAEDPKNGEIFISQSDCLADVQELARQIEAKCGSKVDHITDIGTVIGAHTGPGAIALCFVGRER